MGCLFYEMYYGKALVDDEEILEVFENIPKLIKFFDEQWDAFLAKKLPDKENPDSCDYLISKLLQVNPEKRFTCTKAYTSKYLNPHVSI